MRNKIAGILLLIVALSICGCSNPQTATEDNTVTKDKTARAEIFAMDTIMKLTVYGDDAEEVLAKARERINRYEQLFSVTLETSDVYKLNHAGGKPVEVADETYELIEKSLEISEKTDGLFDISIYPLVCAWGFTTEDYRVPDENQRQEILKQVDYTRLVLQEHKVTVPDGMQIDLGGIAKGYLSQKLVELFREAQIQGAVISLGGNVQTYGSKPDGTRYEVGITDPADGNSIYGRIQIGEKAVITSGSYQRYFEKDGTVYHHIMDKRTGAPADSDLKSVTVLADDGVLADSLATALFVMGKEKAIEYEQENADIDLILIDEKNEVWTSQGVELQE